MHRESAYSRLISKPIPLLAQLHQHLVFLVKFCPQLLILRCFVLKPYKQRLHFLHGILFSLHRHLLVYKFLSKAGDLIAAFFQLRLKMFLLLKHLLLVVFFLPKHCVFLFKFRLGHLDACFKVFGALKFLLLVSFFVLLLLNQIKLSLHRTLPSLLLSSGQRFKLEGVSEWVPLAGVGAEDVVHLVEGLVCRIVLIIVPLIARVFFIIFILHDF